MNLPQHQLCFCYCHRSAILGNVYSPCACNCKKESINPFASYTATPIKQETKKHPYQCPNCKGDYKKINRDMMNYLETICGSCDKGIVWG